MWLVQFDPITIDRLFGIYRLIVEIATSEAYLH